MKKFIISVLSIFLLIITVIIPDFSSFAVDVTINNTIGDVLYDYTSNDLLSTDNYNNYYDTVDNGLKYCVPIDLHYVNNTNTSYLPSNLWNLVSNAFNDNSFKNISFHPDTPEGSLNFIIFFVGPSYSNLMELVSVVPQGDLYIVDGYLISDQPYTIYWVDYSFNINTANEQYVINTNPYIYGGDYKHSRSVSNVSSNGVYEANYNNPSYFIYSEIPFYFTYSSNNDYQDMSYLGQSPYNYDNYINVYNAIGSDTTGFVVDRRTQKMINGDDSEDELLNDVDLMQFEGELGFEYFDFKGYISENQDLIFPNYIANYKLNNYTDLRKDNIEICASYSFDFKLTFKMVGNSMYGYQSANMGSMGFSDTLPVSQNNYGMDLNAFMDDNTLVNYRETSGLHLQSNGIQGYENIQNFSQNSMIADFGRYFYKIMNNVTANKVVNSKRDSYFYITCQFWIEYVDEKGRITQSNKIIRKIDYWGDSNNLLAPVVNNIDDSAIIDDDNEFHNFIDSYNYKKINEDTDGYLSYLPSISNNPNNSSVGDVIIQQNPYPYVLVDIPENDWLNKTPNLKNMLTDFKTMLAETQDGSILTMLPATYSYLPTPVWNYILYGVGICLMIGIWHAITRR